MKNLIYGLIAILSTLAVSKTSIAVTVDSVRYCRSNVPVICNAKTHDEYRAWESHSVPKRHQKRTFIARYASPSRAAVKHLIFIADGQSNGPDFDLNGVSDPSSVSGRVNDFRDYFDRFEASRNIQEISYNLPSQILDGGLSGFNRSNTFVAASWDARFHYASSSDTLNRVANAHYDWLRGKFERNNLDVIILAGHSRGGALVTVLAKKFRQAYPDIPVMVYTLEGVPSRKRSVPPMSSTRVLSPFTYNHPLFPNPLHRGDGYHFDFANYYGNTQALRAVNLLAGQSFLPADINRVRPMAETRRVNGQELVEFDLGWFKQEWFVRSHNSFNNGWATTYILDDLQLHVFDMIAERDRLRPPVARCRATPSYAEGTSATATFADNGSYSANGASIVDYRWEFYRPDGAFSYSVSGQGPHRFGVHSQGSARAVLTVTNSEGVSARGSCSFTLIGGCGPSLSLRPILCDAPFERAME